MTDLPASVAQQPERQSTGAPDTTTDAPSARAARWAWARHWEFWLILLIAAALRLWRPDVSQFLDDQTGLMTLARLGILHGAIPATGIPSSITTLNPPLSIYFLMPAAFFSANPLANVLITSSWNTLGVAFCYIFANRYFGRRVAVVGALLYATCGSVVNYSRFLWQQNYLPPIFVLWGITLYAGCVLGRRRWFVANATLLMLATLLHPVAALLAPVTLVAILLAPRRPRLWEYLTVVVIGLALLAPSIVWEVKSRGSDVRLLLHYFFNGHGKTDPAVFYYLFLSLGAPGASDFAAASPYRLFSPGLLIVNLVAALCFAAGYLILTVFTLRPALALWRGISPQTGADISRSRAFWRHARLWGRATYQGLRADAGWRIHLLLWLWITIPILGMVHHSAPLFVHYLMVLYPAEFLTAAFVARDLPRWLTSRLTRQRNMPDTQAPVRLAPGARFTLGGALVAVFLTALLVAQTTQTSLYVYSLTSEQFSPNNVYGYPLGDMTAADAAISAIEQQQGATQAEIITPSVLRYQAPANYLLVGEHSDRVGVTGNCLILPAPDAGPSLVVSAMPQSNAAMLLPELPNAQQVGAIPMHAGPSLATWRVQGATPLLAGEIALRPITFSDASGARLTLVGVALSANNTLRLRWMVNASTPDVPYNQGATWYRIRVGSQPTGVGPTTHTDCQPKHWIAGETLFTWVALPANPGGLAVVSAQMGSLGLAEPTVGSVRFVADAQANARPLLTLPTAPGDPSLALAPSPGFGEVSDMGAVFPLVALQG